jgi:hypothetical protein
MSYSTRFIYTLLLLSVFLLLIFFAGCIISEYDEYLIILNADGKSGTIIISKYNLQSDQTDPAKQQDDFDNLIQDWKGDQYLLDKVREGVYVKTRSLSRVHGQLVWKEKAIFADIYHLFEDAIMNDSLRIGFGKEETVTKTNGILIQTKDSTIVQWPLNMKRFILKIQKNNFKVTSDFAAKFKSFSKTNK